ncbi:Polar-differentiation response regulator DivK [subsurface metagenome]
MDKKILVIEDNEQNRYLFSFILEKNGYQVITARDGLEGITRAREEKPDLILVDIRLPVMDGYEVTRRLRKLPEFKAAPIIAITAYAMKGDEEKTLEAGCDGYITKPIVPEEFIKVVNSYLKK